MTQSAPLSRYAVAANAVLELAFAMTAPPQTRIRLGSHGAPEAVVVRWGLAEWAVPLPQRRRPFADLRGC